MKYLTIIALCIMLANTNQAQEKQDKFSNRFDDRCLTRQCGKVATAFQVDEVTGDCVLAIVKQVYILVINPRLPDTLSRCFPDIVNFAATQALA